MNTPSFRGLELVSVGLATMDKCQEYFLSDHWRVARGKGWVLLACRSMAVEHSLLLELGTVLEHSYLYSKSKLMSKSFYLPPV